MILPRQFTLPTLINGNADRMLIETCAGLLDQDDINKVLFALPVTPQLAQVWEPETPDVTVS